MLLLKKRTPKNELVQSITKKIQLEPRFHVFLGGYQNPCFGKKSDTYIQARYLGFVNEVDAYLIQDVSDGEILIIPKDAFTNLTPDKEIYIDRINRPTNQYKIGMKVKFYVREEIEEFGGMQVDGRIIASFSDGSHLIHLSDEWYDENDPDKWWSSMDVRFENELFI